MKKMIVVGLMSACCLSVQAQFGLGGQVNWSKYFASGPSFIGFGANGSLVVGNDIPLRLSINYGLPSTTTETTTANRLDSSTEPASVEVSYEEKVSLLNFWLDVQKYFGDGDWEDGGVYGSFGLGYTSAKASYSVDSYDQTLYAGPILEDSNIGQFGLRGAIGYDKALDFGNLFGEFGLNLSANQANGQTIEINLPSFMYFNVGVRHWFD